MASELAASGAAARGSVSVVGEAKGKTSRWAVGRESSLTGSAFWFAGIPLELGIFHLQAFQIGLETLQGFFVGLFLYFGPIEFLLQ